MECVGEYLRGGGPLLGMESAEAIGAFNGSSWTFRVSVLSWSKLESVQRMGCTSKNEGYWDLSKGLSLCWSLILSLWAVHNWLMMSFVMLLLSPLSSAMYQNKVPEIIGFPLLPFFDPYWAWHTNSLALILFLSSSFLLRLDLMSIFSAFSFSSSLVVSGKYFFPKLTLIMAG